MDLANYCRKILALARGDIRESWPQNFKMGIGQHPRLTEFRDGMLIATVNGVQFYLDLSVPKGKIRFTRNNNPEEIDFEPCLEPYENIHKDCKPGPARIQDEEKKNLSIFGYLKNPKRGKK